MALPQQLPFANLLPLQASGHYGAVMHQLLKLHPESHCAAVAQIEVDVARGRPGRLQLNYFVIGVMANLRKPERGTPTRMDNLWRHTCFEAFVRPSQSAAYYEFNFAPSLHWAAYRFDTYRQGMRMAGEEWQPTLKFSARDPGCELQVSLDLSRFPGLGDDVPLQLNLAAVVEETSGRISYWAAAHPPGRADFHHGKCFSVELPAV
jgi:hypothetical protein